MKKPEIISFIPRSGAFARLFKLAFLGFLLLQCPAYGADADARISLSGTELFKQVAPSVVLIVADKSSIGSGVVVAHNLVLTNWHVVQSAQQIRIGFFPEEKGAAIRKEEVGVGRIIKADKNKDLALLRVDSLPARVLPVALGTEDEVEIGADVYAIGHPEGEIWSYTKGIISQLRQRYSWRDETGQYHNATIIQTQTPINPGNSGGPLLSPQGRILGINTFVHAERAGLGYAISVSEIRAFLEDTTLVIPVLETDDVPSFSGRNSGNTGYLRIYDLKRGKTSPRLAFFYPDDRKKPAIGYFDENNDGKPEVYIFDRDRDGRWDISFFFESGGRTPIATGIHEDGKILPTRHKTYKEVPELSVLFGPFPKPWRDIPPLFTCKDKTSPVEIAICGDASLLSQSNVIAEQFYLLLERGGQRAEILADGQKNWLAALRRECRGDAVKECISRKLAARKGFLQSLVDE